MRRTQDSVRLGATLRDLAAVGSTVDLSVAAVLEENVKVEICQVGGVTESTVLELPDGRAGYIFDLEIINQTSETIYLSETELRLPWEDPLFDWLPDPKETERTISYSRKKPNGRREHVDVVSESYWFAGGAELEYPRELVLNHVLLQQCALPPRRPLKGLLLARGGPLPTNLRHGHWLKPTFALIASNHIEYAVEIQLWTNRLEVPKRTKQTPNLYRDPVGLEVGSAAVRNPHSANRTEKSQNLHLDRDASLDLEHLH